MYNKSNKNFFEKNAKMLLQYQISYDIISSVAGVAQLVEQLIRNQQVMGSSPITSSKNRMHLHSVFHFLIYEVS